MSKGAYTREFTPVARPRDFVELDDGKETSLYRVSQMIPLPDIETQEFTVANNDQIRDEALTNLEIWDGWLAQYRPPRWSDQIPDGVSIQVDQGGSQEPLYQNLNQRGSVDRDTAAAVFTSKNGDAEVIPEWHVLEQYVWEQTPPKFTIENTSGAEVTFTIDYTGFALNLEPANESQLGGRTPVYVPVSSIRGN